MLLNRNGMIVGTRRVISGRQTEALLFDNYYTNPVASDDNPLFINHFVKLLLA
jgi:hypothetical protein